MFSQLSLKDLRNAHQGYGGISRNFTTISSAHGQFRSSKKILGIGETERDVARRGAEKSLGFLEVLRVDWLKNWLVLWNMNGL